MNAQLAPLPFPLPASSAAPAARRRQVGDTMLSASAIDGFNALLSRLDADAPPVSADQVVTLARWLQSQPPSRAEALLAERLDRAERLALMLQDSDWRLDAALAERARLLMAYLHQVDDLIPDDLPLLGQLDDALLVELSWPAFAGEAQDYLDFCRYRSLQRPRGNATERRMAWENACLAEVALLQQRRQVRGRAYSAAAPLPERLRVV